MKPNLLYIRALAEDATFLTSTAIASKKFWGYTDDEMDLWKSDLEVSSAYILQHEVIKVFAEDVFVGFYAIKIIEGIPEIDHLWLLPEKIRQYYGREIFEHLLHELKAAGYQKAMLIAEPHAKGFYKKMGGTVIGKTGSKISGRFLDIYEFQLH